jgi:hypothetical protein
MPMQQALNAEGRKKNFQNFFFYFFFSGVRLDENCRTNKSFASILSHWHQPTNQQTYFSSFFVLLLFGFGFTFYFNYLVVFYFPYFYVFKSIFHSYICTFSTLLFVLLSIWTIFNLFHLYLFSCFPPFLFTL